MELPLEIQNIINEYAKPLTNINWRQGSKCCKCFKYAPEFLISNKMSKIFDGDYLWESIISLNQGIQIHFINNINYNNNNGNYDAYWCLMNRLWLFQHNFVFNVLNPYINYNRKPLELILSLGYKTFVYN